MMQSVSLQLVFLISTKQRLQTQTFCCSWSWQVLTLQHLQALSEESSVSWSQNCAMDPTGLRAGMITGQSERAQVHSLLSLLAQKQQSQLCFLSEKTLELSVLLILFRRIEIEKFMQNSLFLIRKLFGKFLLILLRPLLKVFPPWFHYICSRGKEGSSSKWEWHSNCWTLLTESVITDSFHITSGLGARNDHYRIL